MILVIDDDIAVRTSLELLLKDHGYEVNTAADAAEAMFVLQQQNPELIILDLNFSIETSGDEGMQLLQSIRQFNTSVPVILITGWATIDLAVKGMKLGANDFISKPWNNEHLINSVQTLLTLKTEKKVSAGRQELDDIYNFKQIIGKNEKMLSVLQTIGKVAATDASVLIMGESGTGKELIAEAVHQNSLRASKPFVKVNLGGVSASLFESEMFGHVRGAFTDAKYDRTGRFELANKGTIFLDEIGDLDAASQVKLLRVLQDRTYEVLGSSRTRVVDVRVVCATNRNLHEMVANGSFREDLLYRINLITVHLPPLRERPDDIPLLAESFLQNLRNIYNRHQLIITADALKWMKQLSLPGNIRQLKNLVERAVLVSKNDVIGIDELKAQLELSPAKKGTIQLPDVGSITLEELEVQMIKKAMDFHRNKITRVATALGLTRSSLYRRLEKYNIPFDETAD